MKPEQEIKLLKELLYCTKRSCNNCGKVNCENFQRQRIDCCGLWVSYKDYIKQQEEQIESQKEKITQAHIDGYNRGFAEAEEKIADIKENCDLAIEGRDVKIMELEQQIEELQEKHKQEILDLVLSNSSERAELESDFRICEKNADTYYDQLTKAKEIIKELARVEYADFTNGNYSNELSKVLEQAEQFIKEIEK